MMSWLTILTSPWIMTTMTCLGLILALYRLVRKMLPKKEVDTHPQEQGTNYSPAEVDTHQDQETNPSPAEDSNHEEETNPACTEVDTNEEQEANLSPATFRHEHNSTLDIEQQ